MIKNYSWIYFGLYGLLNVLAACHLVGMGTAAFCVTLMILIMLAVIPYKELGAYFFACFPFYNILNAEMGTTSLFYFIIIGIFARVMLEEKEIELGKRVLIYFAIICCSLYNIYAPEAYIKWLLRLIPLIFFLKTGFMRDNITGVMKKYILSMLLSAIWGWIYLKAGVSLYTNSVIWVGYYQTVVRLAGLTGDSVFFGIQCVIAVALVGVLFFKGEIGKKTFISVFCIFSIFIAISYAKTSQLSVVILATLWYLHWLWSKNKTYSFVIMNFFILAVVGALVVVGAYLIMISDVAWFANMRMRLMDDDLLTGRKEIWDYYQRMIYGDYIYWIRGLGMAEYPQEVAIASDKMVKFISRAHNVFLETILLAGIIPALLIFAGGAYWMIKVYIKNKNIIYMTPCIILILSGYSLHGHFEFLYYPEWLLALSVAMIPELSRGEKDDFIPEDDSLYQGNKLPGGR